jgi:hypothetical protein
MAEMTLEQQQALARARARTRAAQPGPSTSPEERQAIVQRRAEEMRVRDEAAAEAAKIEAENQKVLERRLQWQQANSPLERAKLMAKTLIPKSAEMAKNVAVEGGAAGVGQIVGQRTGGTPGRVVGGAVGGAAGSAVNQSFDMAMGTREKFAPGEVVANAVAGAFTTQGAKRNAGINAAAETIRSLIDEKSLPTMEGVSQAAAMGYIAGKVSQKISGKQLTPQDALMEYRNNAFRAVRNEGVVVNPQELSRNTLGLSTIAGEQPMNIAASKHNQYVWQKMARQELGIDNKPLPFRQTVKDKNGKIIPGDIDKAIARFSKPYAQVRKVSESAAKELESYHQRGVPLRILAGKSQDEINLVLKANDNLDQLKRVRKEVSAARAAMKNGEPDAYKAFQAARAAEGAIEDQLEGAASAIGNPRLLKDVKAARPKLAQVFAVRDALASEVTGLIDVSELANMRATSSRPGHMLTGNLAKMADFAEAFGRNAREAVSAGVDRPGAVSLNYAARQIAQGHSSGMLSAGVPFLSSAAKGALLSETLQNRFVKPSYLASEPSIAVRNALMVFGRQNLFDENAEPIEPPAALSTFDR